ncbi:MAG: hemolysin family protein [Acidimicrobiia bacterium]
MSGTDAVLASVAIALFLFSIVLAMAETAFTRMSRIRAIALEEEGRNGADRLARMLEQPEQTLNVVLLLILIAQLTTATLVGALVESRGGAWGIVAGIVLQIVLFFVVGEVAPKTFAVQQTDRVALALSGFLSAITNFPPFRWISRGLIGLANVVLPGKGLKQGPFVTEEDLRTMADVAADEAAIEREERELIHSIFEFGDTFVREVMLPRSDMAVVSTADTVDDAINTAIRGGYSRLPVWDRRPDEITGIVYLKDLVRIARAGGADREVRAVVQPAVVVPEQKRAAELLREMQAHRFHMAIVIDEYGDTAGLVTMEDLLEEIVGPIADEYDRAEPRIERLADGAFLVPGRSPIDELNEALDTELPATEWDTVGGLVFNLLGHVPAEGETVRCQGYELRTERVQGHRIVSVTIRPVEPEDLEATAEASVETLGE